MALSQNGYVGFPTPRFDGPLPRLRRWVIPGTDRAITARDGSAGFLLMHLVLWFHEAIEPINTGPVDEGSYNYRAIRGATTLSNHASGTAVDVNWNKHPLGAVGTLAFQVRKVAAATRIRLRLRRLYKGTIRWGGDYHTRKDEMHYEIVGSLDQCEAVARNLLDTPRGKRILAANPGAKEVILS